MRTASSTCPSELGLPVGFLGLDDGVADASTQSGAILVTSPPKLQSLDVRLGNRRSGWDFHGIRHR